MKKWIGGVCAVVLIIILFGAIAYYSKPTVDMKDGLSESECDTVLSGEDYRLKNIRYMTIPDDWKKTRKAYAKTTCITKNLVEPVKQVTEEIVEALPSESEIYEVTEKVQETTREIVDGAVDGTKKKTMAIWKKLKEDK